MLMKLFTLLPFKVFSRLKAGFFGSAMNQDSSRDRLSPTIQVVIALVAGLALGLLLAGSQSAFAKGLFALLEPIGKLFVGSIRMVVIPLIVACVISGVNAAPDAKAMGRIGVRAIGIFAALVAVAAVASLLIGGPLLNRISLDPLAVEAMRQGALDSKAVVTEGAKSIPTLGAWLVSLVPVNPFKAAVDGAMLPLIVASVAFAGALLHVAPERRAAVMGVVEGVMDASLVLVRGVLLFAPLGVFALSVPLAARMGVSVLGAIAGYIGIVIVLCVLMWALVLVPAAVFIGRIPLPVYLRALLPAQSIAFSSSSSLAALPAMLESVDDVLRLPPSIGRFIIPLASSMFRMGAGIGQTLGVLFIARLYGVDLHSAQMLTIGVMAVLTTFSVPGIPGGSVIVMVPVLMATGIPVEGIGILLGADMIPDMFRTTLNMTGQVTSAVMIAGGKKA